MDGFADLILYLKGLAARAKQASEAIAESQDEADPVKVVEKKLNIKADGFVPMPMMDEGTARQVAANPEALNSVLKGEQLGDAITHFVIGDK